MPKENQNNRLVAFIYILMRDDIPVGKIVEICKQLPCDDEVPCFTDKGLELLARQKVELILKG